MYHRAHRCPHVLCWKEGSVFCLGVLDLPLSYPRIRDAINICHVAFMNPLCLTDYTLLIEVWGPEEMLLKIKGSGDVKVVSRVIRHQRLRLQAVMSAPSSRLASLIYLLTDFMSRRFPPWLTDWLTAYTAYALQVYFQGRWGLGCCWVCVFTSHSQWWGERLPAGLIFFCFFPI